jgi:GTP 3',8-cyclase
LNPPKHWRKVVRIKAHLADKTIPRMNEDKPIPSPNLFMDGTKLDRHLQEVVNWRNNQWFPPIHLEISLTNVCNQKCSFCYSIWTHGKTLMPEKMGIDLITDAKTIGVKSVLIAGEGEPTLNKAYVSMIERAGEVGLDIALNSNAVMMDPSDIQRILPHLSWVRFSVQGSTPELYGERHGCPPSFFDRALRNITLACETKRRLNLKVSIGMQQVLLAENARDSYNIALMARSAGCDYYVIKPCHPHELNTAYAPGHRLYEQHRDILEEAQKLSNGTFKAIVRWNFLKEAEEPRTYRKCLALPFIAQIAADGRVVTCYPWMNDERHQYGSLKDASLGEILRSQRFMEVASWVRDHRDVSTCMPTCRQHNANKYLWWLTEQVPDHLNFI